MVGRLPIEDRDDKRRLCFAVRTRRRRLSHRALSEDFFPCALRRGGGGRVPLKGFQEFGKTLRLRVLVGGAQAHLLERLLEELGPPQEALGPLFKKALDLGPLRLAASV